MKQRIFDEKKDDTDDEDDDEDNKDEMDEKKGTEKVTLKQGLGALSVASTSYNVNDHDNSHGGDDNGNNKEAKKVGMELKGFIHKRVDFDNLVEEKLIENEEKWGKYVYLVPMNRIENSLLSLNQRYGMNSFIMKGIICNEKYFCNRLYKFSIVSNIVGDIESDTNGIYLFHAILKNESMQQVFITIMNRYYMTINQNKQTKQNKDNNKQEESKENEKKKENGQLCKLDYDSNLLLLLDGNNEIPIQCAVFGSYNQTYETQKDLKNIDKQNELITILHRMQRETIQVKMKNIVSG